MKNTFTTPSAQQFGLWFQVLTSWKKLYEAGYWEDVSTSDSRRNQVAFLCATVCNRVENNIAYDKRKELHSNESQDGQRSITLNGMKHLKKYVNTCLH